jgi:hypothetical protein
MRPQPPLHKTSAEDALGLIVLGAILLDVALALIMMVFVEVFRADHGGAIVSGAPSSLVGAVYNAIVNLLTGVIGASVSARIYQRLAPTSPA